jgi:hypothetical protein
MSANADGKGESVNGKLTIFGIAVSCAEMKTVKITKICRPMMKLITDSSSTVVKLIIRENFVLINLMFEREVSQLVDSHHEKMRSYVWISPPRKPSKNLTSNLITT